MLNCKVAIIIVITLKTGVVSEVGFKLCLMRDLMKEVGFKLCLECWAEFK